jgi:endonuclease/exonuclease/phosphatase family metal-dependent hydrolase
MPARTHIDKTLISLFSLIALGTVAVVILGGLVFVLQPFGERIPVFIGVAAILGLLHIPRPLRVRPAGNAATLPPLVATQSRLALARRALAALLACWLGLIAWAELSPGGPQPALQAEPSGIRVVTWNILRGRDGGLSWLQGHWPERKAALASAVTAAHPDILCVQEALQGQLDFLDWTLPAHLRIGVGRDDGEAGGEHCAIYFDRARFEKLDDGTFWLEEPSDRPAAWRLSGPKRICTWVRLRDHRTGRILRVYNTHLYLTEKHRQLAARLIMRQVAQSERSEPLLLAGDFNAAETAPSRRLFALAGLESTSTLTNQPPRPTYQFYGIPLRNLDEILVGPGWKVLHHEVLSVKPGNRYPSDHFGVLADLSLVPEEPID